MHLYLVLLEPDRLKHLLLELFFEDADDLLFMILLSYEGAEAFLNAGTGHVSVSDLALRLCVDFLVALNIVEELAIQLVSLVVLRKHLLHLADFTLDIAHFLDDLAAITVDTVQLV